MLSNKKILERRKFIDTVRNADSYIKSMIYVWEPGASNFGISIDADIALADCHRKINWDFGVYSHKEQDAKKQIKEMRKKMENVRKMMDEFFEKLEIEYQKAEADFHKFKERPSQEQDDGI